MVQSDYYIEATLLQMQLTILEWGDLIRTTRGCMVPDKKRVVPSWLGKEKRKMEMQEPGREKSSGSY